MIYLHKILPLFVLPVGVTLLEGDILAEYAKEMGVPDPQLVKTSRVVNTAEEAHAVAVLRVRDFPAPQAMPPARGSYW